MAAFDPDADLRSDLGYLLMTDTPVTLFWRSANLDATVDWLLGHDYQVVRLDASAWASEHDMHRDMAAALDFPDYYGHNLDALTDCMRDVVAQRYGWRPDSTGLVMVFHNYDAFAGRATRSAQAVLDILATQSRRASLFARRLMCLVHSNDPDVEFDAVGAVPVLWNAAEWLDAHRRPH